MIQSQYLSWYSNWESRVILIYPSCTLSSMSHSITGSGHFLSIPSDCLISWDINNCLFGFPSCLLNDFSASIFIPIQFIFYVSNRMVCRAFPRSPLPKIQCPKFLAWHTRQSQYGTWTTSSLPLQCLLSVLPTATPQAIYEFCNPAICGHSTGRFSNTALAWEKQE